LSAESIAVWILLGIGMAAFVLTAAGMLTGKAFDRLHYTDPAATVGIVAIAAAVVVHHPGASTVIKAILIAILVFFSGPVISHATARAIYERKHRNLKPEHKPAEQEEQPR
jgi:monovalent cation/proton antiporter MnhG/PhaG subunit